MCVLLTNGMLSPQIHLTSDTPTEGHHTSCTTPSALALLFVSVLFFVPNTKHIRFFFLTSD